MKKLFLGLSTTFILTSSLFGIVYSDGTNPNDWKSFTTSKGEVKSNDGAIEFIGNGTKTGFYLSFNPIIKCNLQNHRYRVTWKMKAKRYSKTYIQIMTKNGIRYLTYYPIKQDLGKSGRFLQFGLDRSFSTLIQSPPNSGRWVKEHSRNGRWHTFTRDIERDLKRYEPDNELLEIRAFFIRGSVLIDNVEVLDHTLTDEDRFQALVVTTQSSFTDGSPIKYFSNIGIGRSQVNTLAEDITFLWAFSDEKKDTIQMLGKEKIFSFSTTNERVEIRPLSKNRLSIIYNCKNDRKQENRPQCWNYLTQDIYDVSEPLNPKLISSERYRGDI